MYTNSLDGNGKFEFTARKLFVSTTNVKSNAKSTCAVLV